MDAGWIFVILIVVALVGLIAFVLRPTPRKTGIVRNVERSQLWHGQPVTKIEIVDAEGRVFCAGINGLVDPDFSPGDEIEFRLTNSVVVNTPYQRKIYNKDGSASYKQQLISYYEIERYKVINH